MNRRFYAVECHPNSATSYRPVKAIALPKGMLQVSPRPVAGPFPFTGAGLEGLADAIAAKYGQTASEWITQDAADLLDRLTPTEEAPQ
jgi:hypothetical protein